MVKALFPIGKTQWAKWGDDAREAYNKMRAQGFTHETGVAEANAVQEKARNAVAEASESETVAPVETPAAPKKPAAKRPAPIKKAK